MRVQTPKKSPSISNSQLKSIKRLPLSDLRDFLIGFYEEAFEDGLREAEKEFDDPELYAIVDADRVRETIGEDTYNELIGGKHGTD